MSRPSVLEHPRPSTAGRAAPPPARPVTVDRVAGFLLTAGGAAEVLQMVVPWFFGDLKDAPWLSGSGGWKAYYTSPMDTIGTTLSTYAIMVGAIAGAALLALGLLTLISPASQRPLARIARYPAIASVLTAAWWVLGGPLDIGTAFAHGHAGWYLFVLGGILALIGAFKPLAGPNLTFDKASFMAVFLALPLLIFVVFVLSPFVQAIYYSMTDWKGFSKSMNFTGIANYVTLFTDDIFQKSMLNSIKLGIIVPLVTIVLALAIASMVTVGGRTRGPVTGIKGSSFYRVVSFFPYAVPAIIIGLLWAAVYQPRTGLLDGFLALIGLSGPSSGWLGSESTAMAVSMFVIIWSFVGFYAVLFIAAIKGVSAEVYEAAKLDGAGRFRTAVSVTIPLIRDTIQTAYIYLGIASLDAFVYMMALNSNGGPGYTTITMSQDLYLTAFAGNSQFGLATAMGVVLAVVTLLFATLVFVVNRLTGGRKVGSTR